MAKGRKVEIQFKKFDKAKDQLLHLKEVATFHVWGYRQVKSMPGAPKVMVPETVAVCELSSGEIRLVSPEKVKFLEPEVAK